MNCLSEAIKIAKQARIDCRENGSGGTTLPGKLASEKFPDILKHLSSQCKCIVVTGTNGKTTVCRMLVDMLNSCGKTCFSNREGANMPNGIITAFAINSSLSGTMEKEYAVIECDELYLKSICDVIHPIILTFTNAYPDQPERGMSIEKLLSVFKDVIDSTPCAKVVTTKQLADMLKLNENALIFGSNDEKAVVGDKEYDVHLSMPGKYNIANAAAACAIMRCLGLLTEKAISSLYYTKQPHGRLERFFIDNTEVTIAFIKNFSTLDVSLEHLKTQKNTYTTVIAVNKKTVMGYDVSWLADPNYKSYAEFFNNTVLYGDDSAKLRSKLEEAGIKVKAVIDDGLTTLLEIIRNSTFPVFMFASMNFILFERQELAKMGYVKNFWEE